MVRSLSMMENVVEVCAKHRERMYGAGAAAKDFKDSFVINNCIDAFSGQPEDLIADKITALDQAQGKTSKSVNLRSDCYEKISTYSKVLNLPESEVCRRILYYMLENEEETSTVDEKIQLAALKSKVALLQTQIEASMQTLTEIVNEIETIEGGK